MGFAVAVWVRLPIILRAVIVGSFVMSMALSWQRVCRSLVDVPRAVMVLLGRVGGLWHSRLPVWLHFAGGRAAHTRKSCGIRAGLVV